MRTAGALDGAADGARAAPDGRARAVEPPAARAVQVIQMRRREEVVGARKGRPRDGRRTTASAGVVEPMTLDAAGSRRRPRAISSPRFYAAHRRELANGDRRAVLAGSAALGAPRGEKMRTWRPTESFEFFSAQNSTKFLSKFMRICYNSLEIQESEDL